MFDINFIPLKSIGFSIAVIIITIILTLIINKFVDIVFSKMGQRVHSPRVAAKTRTLLSLLKNINEAILFVIMLLTIMSHWGVNIMPLLTGAGIIGLGLSLGSQTLVKDIIAGFFIIFEDQYNVGDRVKIKGFEGEVDKITLRLTVLRDETGNLVFIPNSQVDTVVLLNNS